MASSTNGSGQPVTPDWLQHAQTALLFRWVLIIATSYLVIYNLPPGHSLTPAALFVVVYCASNLLLTELLPRLVSHTAFTFGLVLFDTLMIAAGLTLTGTASSQFYVLYFVVLFLSALSEQLELVVGAAVLISAAHIYTESRFSGIAPLSQPGNMLRIPFLFAVALFFGNLVREARIQQRAAQEASARERRLDFLSGISHDLRTPLNTIQLITMLLLEEGVGSLTDTQSDLLRRIQASTRHLTTYALNIIDAARIDAGRLDLLRTPVQVGDLIENAVALARSAAEIKGVTLVPVVEPDLPRAYLDAIQMERVLSNLLSNAIKFAAAGGTVTISAQPCGERIALSVRDDGSGIPAAEIPRLLEKYRRGSGATAVEGSGLGLFIVNAIVQAHGGEITLESEVGKGTVITVQLPIGQPQNVVVPLGRPHLIPL